MQLQRRVVVTGLGILSPIGNSKDTAWSNCINGVNGITEVDFGIADCPITVGGKPVSYTHLTLPTTPYV